MRSTNFTEIGSLLAASRIDSRATVTGTDRAVTFRQIAKAVYSDMKTLPVDAVVTGIVDTVDVLNQKIYPAKK